MKRIRKWLLRIGIALVVLALILVAVGIGLVRRPWPEVSGTLNVSGISAPVEIIRDHWGVPHIYAQNEHDLLLAQGYVHAQDRLWQMEILRRFSQGTLGEILGEDIVIRDRLMRTIGLHRLAEQSWPQLDSDTRAILEAYAEGVNSYIHTHSDRLPVEFTILNDTPQPWTPVDTLTLGNLLAFHEEVNFKYELWTAKLIADLGAEKTRRILPVYAQDAPLIIPSGTASRAPDTSFTLPSGVDGYDWLKQDPFTDLVGANSRYGSLFGGLNSNSLSIRGSRTESGRPLLANDPHLAAWEQFGLYENGLHGGRFDSTGFTFPGVPLVLIGHNQRIAWGITNIPADVEDAYIEKLDDPNNPTQYEYMGEWQKLEVIPETIRIRGAEPLKFDVLLTRHGPVVNDVLPSGQWIEPITAPEEKPIAFRWALQDGNLAFRAIVQMNLAANWDEFRSALQYWDNVSENFVFADVEGNIGYQAAGRIPIRVSGHSGTLPVPGWTGDYEWQGYIPFDKLPSLFNPPSNAIFTANNKITSDDYPYWISDLWDPGYRAKRIETLLTGKDSLSLEDIQRIQGDTYSIPAEILIPYLSVVEPETDLQTAALAAVKAWDRNCTIDSVAPSIFETWFRFLFKETVIDEYGQERFDQLDYLTITKQILMLNELMADPNSSWFGSDPGSRDDVVRRSFAEAVQWLSDEYGDDPSQWQWGRIHTVTFTHLPLGISGIAPLESLFNSPAIPTPGCTTSVNANGYWLEWPLIDFGVGMRTIMDVGNWDNSRATLSMGQSEHLFNPHREDQTPLWAHVEYHPMLFSREAVEKNAEATLTLTP